MNIFSTAPITFAQAALGGDVKISTVDGDVLYTVKPGTQTDTKIRLKGKGVPSLRNSNVRGDHYVTLVVQTPTKLNEKAKEALRAFDEACGNRPAAEENVHIMSLEDRMTGYQNLDNQISSRSAVYTRLTFFTEPERSFAINVFPHAPV